MNNPLPESKKLHYATARFNDALKKQTDDIFSLPFFAVLAEGLQPEQWQLYAKQFHITCLGFDRLLKAVVESAQKTDHAGLIAELEENLSDEMGINPPKSVPHFILRKNFFQAVGLPVSELAQETNAVPVLPGTRKHAEEINKIIGDGCVYEQIGAFMAQEFLACGQGFWHLLSGVAKSFPGLESRENEAMKYVYGHIECDAVEHFPHLLKAIDPLMANSAIQRKIFAGADTMLCAELSLYKSFENDILDLNSPHVVGRAFY